MPSRCLNLCLWSRNPRGHNPRSGKGKAWDGLSKYDLTRFNPWFFDREKAFADICDRRGLILAGIIHEDHFVVRIVECRQIC